MPKRASVAYVLGQSPIFKFDGQQAAAYLAALIDGEGTVFAANGRRTIRIVNTDWDLIEAAIECCEILGIHFTVQETHQNQAKPHWKSAWTIMISGQKNLLRCARILPLRASGKRARLDAGLASYKPTPRFRPRRVSDEERDQRVTEIRARALNQRGRDAASKLDVLVRGKETAKVEEASKRG